MFMIALIMVRRRTRLVVEGAGFSYQNGIILTAMHIDVEFDSREIPRRSTQYHMASEMKEDEGWAAHGEKFADESIANHCLIEAIRAACQ
jgi:hypothetical protein